MTWIQVYCTLPTHAKTYALMDALNLKNTYEAVGIIVSVWAWAAVNAIDGNISKFPARAIAAAVDWKKKPELLVDSLETAGFFERTENGLIIHDWEEHASILIEALDRQKEKTKERVRKYRERKRGTCNVTGNVTKGECNAPTVPNLTKPNLLHSSECNNARELFEKFWNEYPTARGGEDSAWAAWMALSLTEVEADSIMRALSTFKVSAAWEEQDGKFVPSAAKWLAERQWQKPPKITSVPHGATGELSDSDLEAIRRIMAEPVEDLGCDI